MDTCRWFTAVNATARQQKLIKQRYLSNFTADLASCSLQPCHSGLVISQSCQAEPHLRAFVTAFLLQDGLLSDSNQLSIV